MHGIEVFDKYVRDKNVMTSIEERLDTIDCKPFVCMSEVKNMLDLVMASNTFSDNYEESLSFLTKTIVLCMDSCATCHVCNNSALFIGEIRNFSNVGITGVGGLATVAGVRTIYFMIKDGDGTNHNI